MQLTIIDTKAGNFGSILNGFKKIGCDINLTQDVDDIRKSKALIIPGVSAFARGMKGLDEAGITNLLISQITENKVPTMGICLGMQLLSKTGCEGTQDNKSINGLGVLDAYVERLRPKSKSYRVPNIGWYDARSKKNSILFPQNYGDDSFYHVHSYHMICNDKNDIAATINYDSKEVVVAVEKDHVFGCQFHPEKSQDAGLDLLNRFVSEVKSA